MMNAKVSIAVFQESPSQGIPMQTLNSAEFFAMPQQHYLAGMQVKTLDVTSDLSVSLMQSVPAQHFLAVTDEQSERIHFSCQLRGSTEVRQLNRKFVLNPSHALVSSVPVGGFYLNCSGNWRTIELRISTQSLFMLAADDGAIQLLNSANNLLVSPTNAYILDAAARLAQRMAQPSPCTLLVHAAALEFIAWHLKNLPGERSLEQRICPRECRLLYLARERLLSDLSRAPTIEQLARETGLNTLKIKRGFKTLFGTTTYDLFQRERMQRALGLLPQHSVTETALLLGYSNISHFSAAFRKQFGRLPSEIRRSAG